MRGLRLRAEKAETVGEHYTQIVKKKTVCGVTEIQIPTLCLKFISRSSLMQSNGLQNRVTKVTMGVQIPPPMLKLVCLS